jgi:hypothetical protein
VVAGRRVPVAAGGGTAAPVGPAQQPRESAHAYSRVTVHTAYYAITAEATCMCLQCNTTGYQLMLPLQRHNQQHNAAARNTTHNRSVFT